MFESAEKSGVGLDEEIRLEDIYVPYLPRSSSQESRGRFLKLRVSMGSVQAAAAVLGAGLLLGTPLDDRRSAATARLIAEAQRANLPADFEAFARAAPPPLPQESSAAAANGQASTTTTATTNTTSRSRSHSRAASSVVRVGSGGVLSSSAAGDAATLGRTKPISAFREGPLQGAGPSAVVAQFWAARFPAARASQLARKTAQLGVFDAGGLECLCDGSLVTDDDLAADLGLWGDEVPRIAGAS
jgi:hypothetical protein